MNKRNIKKLRIAQIAPVIESVPPKKYGGIERVIYNLTEELVKKGHDVTLFASGDSLTSAKLISVTPKNLREAKSKDLYGQNTFSLMNVGLAYQMQDKFDIIHDHNNELSLPTANIARTPVVMTLHGAFNMYNKPYFETLNQNINYVSISNAQAASAPNLNYIANVYNGLDMENYPFSETHDGYLLFVGRITFEKGVHNAIEVAKFLHLPLIIAAKLETASKTDVEYFKSHIEPNLNDQIRWVGEVDEEERNKLMSRAMAFLHPVTWKEPFGLTLIESMACGCPVIAFNKGSIPEVIQNGRTGFVVEDVEQMVAAIVNIKSIDRKYCREYALEKFSAKKMADGYEEVYRIVANQKRVSIPRSSNLDLRSNERPVIYAHEIKK